MVLASGWAVALALLMLLLGAHRRLEGVARADHEIRGGLCALSLALASLGRDPAQSELTRALRTQLDRVEAGVEDLSGVPGRRRARLVEPLMLERWVRESAAAFALGAGDRRVDVDWRAGDIALESDRGRLSQVLSNLLANALEHGAGTVRILGSPTPAGVRIEVTDEGRAAAVVSISPARGRGLRIADDAARQVGSSLHVDPGDDGFRAGFELPVARR